jgi:hypothetical protein
MEVILRYTKVNAVKNRTVSMTGLNPPTGKHVEFVFERIDDPILKSLKYALNSRIFIKVLAGKKGEPDFEFQEEKPPETREDSYFTIFSYVSKVGYNPQFLRELDHYLVTMGEKPFKELGRYLLNATDKLGMVFYAKDQISRLKKVERPSYIEIRYHVVNAIISCKGCLDALATILNEVYGIGYSKGKIDLATTRSDLLHRVITVNKKLGFLLKKYEKWINQITEYRDFVLHRIMLTTPPLGPTSDASGLTEPVKVQVPLRPLTLDYVEHKRILWVEAEDHCQFFIERLQELIEIACLDLLQLIKSKTYFPI